MRLESPDVDTASLQAMVFQELEQKVWSVLQHYASVHRGVGQHAQISTRLYGRSRNVVLEHLGLEGNDYWVVFGCAALRSTSHLRFED